MRESWFLLLVVCELSVSIRIPGDSAADDLKLPTVFVATFIRHECSTLPFFFTSLANIEYPKDRMRLRIYRNPNDDYLVSMLKIWMDKWRSRYHSIDLTANNGAEFEGLRDRSWSEERYRYVIRLREEALEIARRSWADYIWLLDCDALLVDSSTLISLMKHDIMIVAPMLRSDDMYSNFWCGMTSSYYYKRTDEYEEILYRRKIGCFAVPMVHSAVLVHLRNRSSDKLTFDPSKITDYDGPVDDIIAFAVGANKSGLELYVCNDRKYGYTIVPYDETSPAQATDEEDRLLNLKLFVTVDEPPLSVDTSLVAFVNLPPKTKFGFDEIFVINLKRRTERKARMEYCFDQFGIDARFIEAVDGRSLEDEELHSLGVSLMPDYQDPYHRRPMKKGEIGCFLSHYNIWREIIEKNMSVALILEDDVRFARNFVRKLESVIREIHLFSSMWDLVYIGRKIMKPDEESRLNGSNILVYPDYSYWTIGYIVNRDGARKLLNVEPLSKMLPVDEFLPIMYNKHPRQDWKAYFSARNLQALSVNPLIIFPMKYTNEEGYVSDTEDSLIVTEKKKRIDELRRR